MQWMFGVNHSVSTLHKERFPWIHAVKCSCHSIHLCASHSGKKLSKYLEDICRNIYFHFNASSQCIFNARFSDKMALHEAMRGSHY